MVLLRIVRRLLIFAVFASLLLNGFCLVYASVLTRKAEAPTDVFKLHVKLKSQKAADDLVNDLKKDKSDLAPKATVSTIHGTDEVPTGKFYAGIEIDASVADSVARTLKNAHNDVIVESAGAGKKRIRLRAVFASSAAAKAHAAAATRSVSDLLNITVLEQHRSVQTTAYEVEVTVTDEAALDAVKQYVEGKAPGSVEP